MRQKMSPSKMSITKF